MATPASFRLPDPLKVTGSNVAENWRRFQDQWDNYVVAADLTEASSERQAAIFLTCVGGEAYDVYRSMTFASDAERKRIKPITDAFKAYCIGSVNVTYERYMFNRRIQETGERFDTYLGELRRMAKSCSFGEVEESMLRDRIVVGIRDDTTRHKLLQIRDLTLAKAVDICKASEDASRQLRAMTSSSATGEVQPITSSRGRSRYRPKPAGKSVNERRQPSEGRRPAETSNRKCQYCDRLHSKGKQFCPAYNKTCRLCNKVGHFQIVCRSTKKPEVHAVDNDDELLVLSDELLTLKDRSSSERWYTRMLIDRLTVSFMLDCGATVNLIPAAIVAELGRTSEIRQTDAALRMFDKTPLDISGVIQLPCEHLRTGLTTVLDFYVTNKHSQAILGCRACVDLQLLKPITENICEVAASCSDTDLIAEYADVFEGLGKFAGTVHFDIDDTVPPVQTPLRRLPFGIRDKVAAELRRLETLGIIAPVTEPTKWVSALLVTMKANGDVRLCMDPKPLNRALKRVPHCMPTLTDVLPKLSKVKVMSSVDAKDGFFHCELDTESSYLTTTETPFGRIRWLRLPFGTSPSPELFQAKLMESIKDLSGISCVADDILVVGSGETEADAAADHHNNLRALLQRCRDKGIRLNKNKLKLNRKSLLYCGHLLTRRGVQADPRKVTAIKSMPAPVDRKGVLRLIGFATYLSKFCPRFSDVIEPLRSLAKRDNEFVWRPDPHERAFSELKRLIIEAPTLAYYDVTKPVTIQCDASQGGLGCTLLQDGRPVEFASKALNSTQQQYAQIEKELLAILFAMERFDSYVYARSDVIVETDHKPLIAIHKKSLNAAPKRLQRMLLRLQRYNYTLVYRPGSELVLADTLSRAYPTMPADYKSETATDCWEEIAELDDDDPSLQHLQMVASKKTIDQLSAAAAADPIYQLLIDQVKRGWPDDHTTVHPDLRVYSNFADELTVAGNFVYKGERVVIPQDAREDILNRLHAAHNGTNSCIRRARETVFYPGITADIKRLTETCDICRRHLYEEAKEPLMSYTTPSRPWERVGVDVFTQASQDYLVTVDYLSGYFEVDRLPSKKIDDITYVLRQQFARHGIPAEVVSDNSPFNSASFAKFAQKWEFRHVTSSPGYPQSNGRAEAAVKTAKRIMQRATEAATDPLIALLEWRNTPNASSGLSPCQVMFGRRTRTPLPTASRLLSTPTAPAAAAALTASKEKQAQYYNKGTRKRAPLNVGQTVRIRFADDTWRKAQIIEQLPHRSYNVQLEDGTVRRRNSRHIRSTHEPPIVIKAEPPELEDNTANNIQQPAAAETPSTSATGAVITPSAQTHGILRTTRSGRVVKQPVRFRQ
jgi:hypothetical protein